MHKDIIKYDQDSRISLSPIDFIHFWSVLEKFAICIVLFLYLQNIERICTDVVHTDEVLF